MNSIRTAILGPPNPAARDPEEALPTRARALALMDRAATKMLGADGKQLAISFGSRTIPVGLMRQELNEDPDRVEDYLRAHGVTLDTLNAVLTEALSHPENAGAVIDLAKGSATSRAFGIDGIGDAMVVDHHLQDSKALIAESDRKPHLADAISVSSSGFMKSDFVSVLLAIAETLLKLVTFWQASTVTYEGKGIDDQTYRELGKSVAKEQPAVWQLMVSLPFGESTLRDHLRANKPEGAHSAQWNRAVELIIAGAKAEIGALPEEAQMGSAISVEQREVLLRTMQASGNTPQVAAGLVALSRAEPAAMRNAAIALLPQLPAIERGNLISLFTPNTGEPNTAAESRLAFMRDAMNDASPEARAALFETLRHAGFRVSIDSVELEPLQMAIATARDIADPAVRVRYLALLPRLGVSRMELASATSVGLGARLRQLEERGDNEAIAALLTQFEANIDSTSSLRLILARGVGSISLYATGASLDAEQRTLVLDTFRLRTLSLRTTRSDGSEVIISAAQPPRDGEVSLAQYFADPAYRRTFLMSMPASPNASLEQRRAAFERLLFSVAKSSKEAHKDVATQLKSTARLRSQTSSDLYSKDVTEKRDAQAMDGVLDTREKLLDAASRGLAGMTLDIRPGTSLHGLFALDAASPQDPVVRMASSCLATAFNDFPIKMPGAGIVQLAELQQLLVAPDPQAAFKKRFPKLDFRDTILAFAYFIEKGSDLESETVVDLTRPGKDEMMRLISARVADGKDTNLAPKLSRFLQGTFAANVDLVPPDPETIFTGGQTLAFSPVSRFQFSHMGPGGDTAALETVAIREKAKKTFEHPPKAWGIAPNTQHPLHAFAAIGALEDRVHDKGEREDADLFGKVADFAKLSGGQVHVISATGPEKKASARASFAADSRLFTATFSEQGGVPDANIERFIAPDVKDFTAAFEARIMATKPGDALVLHFSGHGSVAGMAFKGGVLGGEDLKRLIELADSRGVKLVIVSSACKSGERVEEARSIYVERLRAAGQLPPIVASLNTVRGHLVNYVDYANGLLSQPSTSQVKSLPTPKALLALCSDSIGGKPGAYERMTELGLQARAEFEALAESADKATGAKAKALREQAQFAYHTMNLLESVGSLIDARIELSRLSPRPDRVTEILSHPLLREAAPIRMQKDKTFLVGTVGPLSDLITAEMNVHIRPLDLASPPVAEALLKTGS